MRTGGTGLTDLVADRGFDLKFTTGLKAELDIVLHCAGNPTFLGYPGTAKPIPLIRHTISRMDVTASIR